MLPISRRAHPDTVPCSADFQVGCIAGFSTRAASAIEAGFRKTTACRLGNRRYSRFGNLRYVMFGRSRPPWWQQVPASQGQCQDAPVFYLTELRAKALAGN